MKKVLKVLGLPLKWLLLAPIYMYKIFISPLLPHCCIYRPTCSTYAVTAIKRFGAFKGGWLAFKRIMRCAPGYEGGTDRVPENIKGDFKWLI